MTLLPVVMLPENIFESWLDKMKHDVSCVSSEKEGKYFLLSFPF